MLYEAVCTIKNSLVYGEAVERHKIQWNKYVHAPKYHVEYKSRVDAGLFKYASSLTNKYSIDHFAYSFNPSHNGLYTNTQPACGLQIACHLLKNVWMVLTTPVSNLMSDAFIRLNFFNFQFSVMRTIGGYVNCCADNWVTFISRVSCQKNPTRHAYAWQIGPFWQDTLDLCSSPAMICRRPKNPNLVTAAARPSGTRTFWSDGRYFCLVQNGVIGRGFHSPVCHWKK